MSERAGRGEVRVKPHLLDQYRPTHKPCSPLREHSLGAGHTGYRTSPIAWLLSHLLWRCFVLLCRRCRSAFPRASRRACQDLFQGASGPSGSLTSKAQKTRQVCRSFQGCKGTFQPLPGLTGLQGFQAKPLQTAPSDSSALKAPPEMAMIGSLAGRPLGLPGLL